MKKRFLLLLVPITAFLLESCCNCDEPIVYTISPSDIAILPVNANDDSISYKNIYEEIVNGSSYQNCDEEGRGARDCGFGKSLGCDCPDSKDDACEYDLHVSGHYFTISFVKNSGGLHTKFILDGKHITQTGTLNSFILNNKEYSNVLVFEYNDVVSSRALVSDAPTPKTLYAPGIGLLQLVGENGDVLTIAE